MQILRREVKRYFSLDERILFCVLLNLMTIIYFYFAYICFYRVLTLTSDQVLSDDAKQNWIDQYNSSAEVCSHAYW